jgi:predicted nucleic acid-binding protein
MLNEVKHLSGVGDQKILMGISRLPSSNRRTELEIWLASVLTVQFAGRVLALDGNTFLTWGQMAAQRKQQGTPMAVMDSLIAATARQHKMVLVTRNVADFKTTGLSLLNPWE